MRVGEDCCGDRDNGKEWKKEMKAKGRETDRVGNNELTSIVSSSIYLYVFMPDFKVQWIISCLSCSS